MVRVCSRAQRQKTQCFCEMRLFFRVTEVMVNLACPILDLLEIGSLSSDNLHEGGVTAGGSQMDAYYP